jgi:hypothetical protein
MIAGTSVPVFWHFQGFLLYFTRIYNCIIGSDGLKSLFHVAMKIRNSNLFSTDLQNNILGQYTLQQCYLQNAKKDC